MSTRNQTIDVNFYSTPSSDINGINKNDTKGYREHKGVLVYKIRS